MNKLTLCALTLAAGAFALAADNQPNPLTIRAGLTWPTDSAVRNVKKNGLTVGLNYDLGQQMAGQHAMSTAVYLDYHTLGNKAAKLESYGIGYQVSTTLSEGAGSNPIMGGLGIGYYSVKATGLSSSGRLGGKVFLSTALSHGISLTAAYNLIGTKDNLKPSYFSVELGYKF